MKQVRIEWIFKYVSIYKRSILHFLGLEVVCSILSLVLSVLLKWIVDHLVGFSVSGLFVLISWYVFLQIVEVLIHHHASRVHLRVHHTILHDLQLELYKSISFSLPFGHKVTCLEKDVKNVADTILNVFPKLVTSSVGCIGSMGILLYYHVGIGCIALLSLPILIGVYYFCMQGLIDFQKDCQNIEDETMEGLYENVSVSDLQHLQHKSLSVDLKQFNFQSRIAIVLFLIGMGIEYVCFGVSIVLFLNRSITLGTLVLFFTMIVRVFETLKDMVDWVPVLIESSVSYERMKKAAK